MKLFQFFLAILIGLFACKQNKNSTTESDNKKDKTVSEINLDFVRTYEGQIDSKHNILLKLTSNGGNLKGNYFYKTEGVSIQVEGKVDRYGEMVLNEFDNKGNQTGLFKGRFVNNNNKIEGNWSKPNGEKLAPFILIESNTPYESLEKQILNDKYSFLSGSYETKENASVSTATINYLGDSKIRFEIITVTQNCTGDVNGTVLIDKNGFGRFSGENCNNLTFKFSKEKLTINEIDCSGLHGFHCSFNGNYFKTK